MFLENWICSYIFQSSFDRNKKVDFIEQFNEKLLVKQENENLQILDVRNFEELTVVSGIAMESFGQDLIISYCKPARGDLLLEADSIKISNILSGQCLAKTKAGNSLPLEKNNCSSKCNLGRVADAPEDITALFYDE
ncbi:hypothetical protein ACET3Z_014817 [Daucus carota]